MYVGLCRPCITDEEIGNSGGNMRMMHFVETEFWLVEREVYAILGNNFFIMTPGTMCATKLRKVGL